MCLSPHQVESFPPIRTSFVHYHFSGFRGPRPDALGHRGRRKEQLTHCHWRSRSLALNPVTGLGRSVLPGPGRVAAVGVGPGLVPARPAAVPADPAGCQGAASALPLSGMVGDRLVTKVEAPWLVTLPTPHTGPSFLLPFPVSMAHLIWAHHI